MSHYVKKYYNHPKGPKNVLFFLHGYNGNTADIAQALAWADLRLSDTLIVTPESTEICEKNPQKKQWYSLRRFDPTDKRRDPSVSADELQQIYASYAPLLTPVAENLNELIDSVLAETGLTNDKLTIAGFSQGAMLACYTSLIRRDFDGKCLMFSGVVAGAPTLAKIRQSAPDVWLFHGKEDLTVNYKTLDFSLCWLQTQGICARAYRYDHLAHKMREDEIADATALLCA